MVTSYCGAMKTLSLIDEFCYIQYGTKYCNVSDIVSHLN